MICAALICVAALAVGTSAAQARAKFLTYKITVGVTGQASETGKGMCGSKMSIGLVCEINDHATFHIDEEFRNATFIVGRAPRYLHFPKNTSVGKHTVNGSFTELGSAYNQEGHLEPFNCSNSLKATEGNQELGEMIAWRRSGSHYSFTAGTEAYGFTAIGNGSGECKGESWFGGGHVAYPPGAIARFEIPTRDIGKRDFTKVVGEHPQGEHCGHWNTDEGSCTNDWGWHAVVKFARTREVSF